MTNLCLGLPRVDKGALIKITPTATKERNSSFVLMQAQCLIIASCSSKPVLRLNLKLSFKC